MFITLFEVKRHLNIETVCVDDDPYLQDLIAVAQHSATLYCNGGLDTYTDQTIPVTVKQATLMLVAHFFLNRAIVAFSNGSAEIPYTLKFLLDPYKNFTAN